MINNLLENKSNELVVIIIIIINILEFHANLCKKMIFLLYF